MARRKNVKRIDPRYFLHETVNRNDDGSVREEGEALDEDVFSAIGDTATKFFGSKEGKRELFWRKQGKARAEQTFDSVYGDSAEEDFLDKEDILHDAQTIFMAMKGNPKFQASKAVKAAVKNRKDSTSAAGAAGEARLASSAAARAAKEKAEEKAKRAAARSAEEDAFNKSWEAGEEKERKRGEKIRADRRWASQVRSGGPAAGSSTNRRRRRNRGELEEGWTDLFKSKKQKQEKYWSTNHTGEGGEVARNEVEHETGLTGLRARKILDPAREEWLKRPNMKIANVKAAIAMASSDADLARSASRRKSRKDSEKVDARFAATARAERDEERAAKKAAAKAAEDAKLAADHKAWERAEEKERKRGEEYDAAQRWASQVRSGGPAAGSSTNRRRRRNRGELEEGWTDLFKSKKPEGEKEIRLAKRKIWRKREEKILGWMLDGYERHLERKGKKFSFIHKDQIKKDVLRQVKDAYLKDAEKTDGTWKGDEVFLRTLSSSLPKKFFAARSKAGGARREKEAREQEWEAGREGREHRARVKAEEDAASQAQRTRSAEEKERKKRIAKEKYDWEQGAYTRSQSGPAAGSSTDRSRRRNRGELEE